LLIDQCLVTMTTLRKLIIDFMLFIWYKLTSLSQIQLNYTSKIA